MSLTQARTALTDAIEATQTLLTGLQLALAGLDGEETEHVPGQAPWTKAKLAQFWTQVQHLPGVRALFEVGAASPGGIFNYTALVQHSGLTEMQQRNEHARMSRIARSLFGTKAWPIECWQGATEDATGAKDEMRYRMSETIAVWWHEITTEPS